MAEERGGASAGRNENNEDDREGGAPTRAIVKKDNLGPSEIDGVPKNEDYAFLANEIVFECIELRTGLILTSILVILDSVIEMIFGVIFQFSWFLWIYAFLILFGGIAGLYGSFYNNAKIIHFFYFCAIGNLMIQTVILIWAGIVYYNETDYIILMIFEVLMTIILWVSFLTIMQKYRQLMKRHYSQKLLPISIEDDDSISNAENVENIANIEKNNDGFKSVEKETEKEKEKEKDYLVTG